jgi:hypothetical protein
MDEELAKAEKRKTTSTGGCRGGAPIGLAGTQRTIGAAAPTPARKRRTLLDVVFQRTDLVATGFEIRLAVLMARARHLMSPHGLDFAGLLPEIGPVVPQNDPVHAGLQVDTFALHAASEAVMPGRPTTLRVIFCFFRVDISAFGVTDGGRMTESGPVKKKFVLVNMLKTHDDLGTLLHEIVHAAYPMPKLDHDRDPRSVFSEAGSGRDVLPADHAAQIARAYFAR